MCIYILVSLCTKLYMITYVNVEYRGYDYVFIENEGYAFGENEGGDVEDVARDQDQGHENS